MKPYDLLIIGGGINGAGIARDAAGRGFSVLLAEAGDFGGATSSASTKLLHGGLRYLEYFEFRLVREALAERELLLRAMPHLSRPMRFVLPYDPQMRFEATTPASRLIALTMPWLRGRRPAWMVRAGLAAYDRLGGRGLLPPTRLLDLRTDPAGAPLRPGLTRAFEYSDGWVDDSRMVIGVLRDAVARGAQVHRSMPVERAEFRDGLWRVQTGGRQVAARMVVNAAGPWVDRVLAQVFGANRPRNVRLVRGSHIVVPARFGHDRAYFFQNPDARIIFAIPYEGHTLIGTTDVDHPGPEVPAEIAPAEIDYLCTMASRWFASPVTPAEVLWTYSGVRPLYDEGGGGAAAAATRDYVLKRDPVLGGGTLINIFGGKITTFRKLAESALALIEETLGRRGPPWTAQAPLPGGGFEIGGVPRLAEDLRAARPWLDAAAALRLVRAYGTEAAEVAGREPGRDFGAGLREPELRWLAEREWARTAQDVAFRRSRLGLRLTGQQLAEIDGFLAGLVR